MTTDIYVISGFLGAGKTTLIQKLLKEAFQKEKVVLIENDFGEISVDAALLKEGNVEVTEISSGCICCSLSGDFVKALKEVLDRFRPDKIVIEPSGVGKLSDIVKSCSDPRIQPLARVQRKITVADVKRCKMYLDNFGEFFEDQIKNADIIVLSRIEVFPDRVNSAQELIRSLNKSSAIIAKPWDQIDGAALLYTRDNCSIHTGHSSHENCCGHHGDSCMSKHHDSHEHNLHSSCDQKHHNNCKHKHHDDREHNCHGGYEHNHDSHRHGHCDGHKHTSSAEDVFDTVTIRTNQIFDIEDLRARVSAMDHNTGTTILRAKGIVRGTAGYINLQYLPGDIQIAKCTAAGNMICIIGRNLNRRELCAIFGGE